MYVELRYTWDSLNGVHSTYPANKNSFFQHMFKNITQYISLGSSCELQKKYIHLKL